MDPWLIGVLGITVFVILLFFGVHIFYASAMVGLVGIAIFKGVEAAQGAAGFMLYSFASKYALSVIPLFILMGYFAYSAGITEDIFAACRKWVGHIRGGMPIATAFGCAGFAACSGSSVASAALMSKLAIPEMLRDGCQPRLAAGVVAASGTLASLIPPSILIVVYGIIADQSIGKLLVAGFIPGIVSVLIYAGMINVRCHIDPTLCPRRPSVTWKERIASLPGIWGMIFIIVLILGGIYAGIFTPSEAGGIGAFGTFIILLIKGRFSWVVLRETIKGTGLTTFMALGVMLGIYFVNIFLVLSGFTSTITSAILASGMHRYLVLIMFLIVYVILGMFIGAMGMVMITVPLFLPVIMGLGFDPIWFGILVIKMGEVAAITPPIGINVFVVHSIRTEIPTMQIFRGILPFLLMDFLTVAVLIAFPQIIMFLPNMMR